MRKLTCFLFTLALFGLTGPASAQETASINVNAEVIEGLGITGDRPLNFGQVLAASNNYTETVDPGDTEAGKFSVTGSETGEIQVTFTKPNAIDQNDGDGSMGLELNLYGSEDGNTIDNAPLTSGSTVNLVNGEYFFYLAGDLTVGDANSNPVGTYQTTFQLEVAYTGV